MIVLLLVTVALIGLRLWGETSNLYQNLSHSFVSGLIGYTLAVRQWEIILYIVLLCVTESYMVLCKFFPQLSLSTILQGILPAKPKA